MSRTQSKGTILRFFSTPVVHEEENFGSGTCQTDSRAQSGSSVEQYENISSLGCKECIN